jgi:hypothetical protein
MPKPRHGIGEIAPTQHFFARGAIPWLGGRIIIQLEQSCKLLSNHDEKESAIMMRIKTGLAGAIALANLFLGIAMVFAADDNNISFKKRGDEEKRFARTVGTAIVKAAHKSARKIDMVKYEYAKPKANRTNLNIQMEYHGAVSDKRYVADIVVKIDSSNKDAWEALNIEYTDNNNIRYNVQKVQDLIKEMNK